MATTTTNYGLKKYEGADYFNPLTFENANADTIDQAMFANKQQGVGSATELTAGTVHALTRSNQDSPIFAFTATSAYHFGDTFTVDGTPVTALMTSGENLEEGAYIVGAEVLCYLRSTQLTVFISKKPDVDAVDVSYDNTNVDAALDDAFDKITGMKAVLASATADGVKNYESLLNEIGSAIDQSKIDQDVKLVVYTPGTSTSILHVANFTLANGISFTGQSVSTAQVVSSQMRVSLTGSGSFYRYASMASGPSIAFGDISATVPASGVVIKICA